MIGFLDYQGFCPDLNLSALTEWLRALPGAFPNRVFKSEEGYLSTTITADFSPRFFRSASVIGGMSKARADRTRASLES